MRVCGQHIFRFLKHLVTFRNWWSKVPLDFYRRISKARDLTVYIQGTRAPGRPQGKAWAGSPVHLGPPYPSLWDFFCVRICPACLFGRSDCHPRFSPRKLFGKPQKHPVRGAPSPPPSLSAPRSHATQWRRDASATHLSCSVTLPLPSQCFRSVSMLRLRLDAHSASGFCSALLGASSFQSPRSSALLEAALSF